MNSVNFVLVRHVRFEIRQHILLKPVVTMTLYGNRLNTNYIRDV